MAVGVGLNRVRVLWGKPPEDGVSEPAILLHVDNGGTVCIEQEQRVITVNRESLPELIAELRSLLREEA